MDSKKIIFLLILMPFFTYPQIMITGNIIERTDDKKKVSGKLDLSIGKFIANDLMIGLTNEDAIADYIQEGYNPIKDSLKVSSFQLFLKYYYQKGLFLLLKMPTYSNVVGISRFDRMRIGGGFIFYSKDKLDFDISYDFLLNPNRNEWKKGKLTIGLSTSIDVKFPKISTESNFLHKFVDWLNTPLSNGYRESMCLSKAK